MVSPATAIAPRWYRTAVPTGRTARCPAGRRERALYDGCATRDYPAGTLRDGDATSANWTNPRGPVDVAIMVAGAGGAVPTGYSLSAHIER